MKKFSLSFLIPAYNDERTITQAVGEAHVVGKSLHIPFEIFVIDDASRDRTLSILLALKKRIKELRKEKGWTQAELGERAGGMKQERISALENVDYDAWTVKTLRKLAKAFDTGLQVSFVPCSDVIMGVVNVTRDRLGVPARTDDLDAFRRHKIMISGGKWKAIDGSHLAPVTMFSPPKPVDPDPQMGWQRLSQDNLAPVTAAGR